jgi:putative transposase
MAISGTVGLRSQARSGPPYGSNTFIMPNYRRFFRNGGTYFFTVVTHERRRFLTDEDARGCLHAAIDEQRKNRPFELMAIVLLPDHLHAIWTLPSGDSAYSTRWAKIKERFTRSFLFLGGEEGTVSASRRSKRERAVWQRRFWEHTCQNDDDLKRHLDYLHWNPVKHGLVSRVRDWPWSSFHRFVELGEYDIDWGSVDPCPDYAQPEWE